MSLIEGIGDEVVEFFIGLIIVTIGLAAWWSTRIAERPLIRTVLVFERRAQSHRSQANSAHHNGSASDERRVQPEQRNYVRELPAADQEVSEATSESEENKPPAAGTSVNSDRPGAGDMTSRDSDGPSAEQEQSAIVESMDSDACVLRRRRLEFFQGRQETLIASDVDIYDAIDNTSNNDQQPETVNTDVDSESMEENLPPSRSESTETTETTVDEDDIRIKLKYINDDLKLVNGKLQEPLGDFKRRHFEFELANDKLVRLIFNGQVLQRDDVTLQGCGMFDNCVVHCLVHQKRNMPGDRTTGSGSNLGSTGASSAGDSIGRGARGLNSHSNSQQQAREWDLGNLFFAIVSFVLGAAWYFRYEYAQLYTVTATVALVGLTGIFTVLLVGMYFPDPEPPVQPMRS